MKDLKLIHEICLFLDMFYNKHITSTNNNRVVKIEVDAIDKRTTKNINVFCVDPKDLMDKEVVLEKELREYSYTSSKCRIKILKLVIN